MEQNAANSGGAAGRPGAAANLLAFCLLSLGWVGCRIAPPAPDSFSLSEVHQITGSFVSGCAGRFDWAERFAAEHGRPAVVRIRGMVNATHEDLDTTAIVRAVAEELEREPLVTVAPASRAADFMLTGRLSPEIDRRPDAPLTVGHRRYIGRLALLRLSTGQTVCSATGSVVRWFDD